ncbi:MAG: ATP synthase F1 subunit delta [Eubacteriales bacterium]|nr:ATP synthase F1 subunit delta [Eubacteriales bacterium]
MADVTVDMTYGKALFMVAQDLGKTDLFLEEATELVELFKREKSFFEFLCTPVISASEKKTIIKNVFEGRISEELVHLIFILVDKKRIRHFAPIVQRYRLLLNKSRGFSIGTIFSVLPLSKEQLASFEEKTGKLLQKKVKLENRTDSTIIGGIRIFIEGKVIDATIKKRLHDLKASLH